MTPDQAVEWIMVATMAVGACALIVTAVGLMAVLLYGVYRGVKKL